MSNPKKPAPRAPTLARADSVHAERRGCAPALLTTQEAARELSISPRTLRKLVQDGEIPTVRVRSLVRFDARDLSAWVEEKKVRRRQPDRGAKEEQA